MAAEPLKTIFLSASMPDPNRVGSNGEMWEIHQTIYTLVDAVLPHGRLVFAYHPSISPIVVDGAKRIRIGQTRLRAYMSEYFRQLCLPSSTTHVDIHWTPEVAGSPKASVARMRELMITNEEPICGVFIGGMEVVDEEFRIFRRIWPDRPVLPIASTGAAAKILLDAHEAEVAAVAPPTVAGTIVQRLRGDLGCHLLIHDVVRPLLDSIRDSRQK